jgi:dimethylhistidine N-methyltransferase
VSDAGRAGSLLDLQPAVADLRSEVLRGLRQRPKALPSKFFYDERGSALFDQICELPEYYLTRAEVEILTAHGAEIGAALGPGATVVGYGTGRGTKTRLLLDHLDSPRAYVPIDIARGELERAAAELEARYPGLQVLPVCADFTAPRPLPAAAPAERRLVFFPGSTIGNFHPPEARAFLARGRQEAPRLLVGVDLKKDPAVLHAAYNDPSGVTAAFNKNLLARLNRELGADFDLEAFDHYAPYEPVAGRVAMYLVARRAQSVRVAREAFVFAEGEAVATEWSYKYSPADFEELARSAGWTPERQWLDAARRFAVFLLRVQ